MAFGRNLFEILRVEVRENFLEFSAQAMFFEQPPVRVRRESKTVQDADALRLQRAEQLAEGCVLASNATSRLRISEKSNV